MINHSANHHQECYGAMLPNLSKVRDNVPLRGKVFGCKIESNLFHRRGHVLGVDLEQWDACVDCPDYESCYALSMAAFTLGDKVRKL